MKIIWGIFLALSIWTVSAAPVQAGEQNCKQALADYIAGPLDIVKGMADYKAAMDAGYAACMAHYPEEFAPLQPVGDFMQTNMQTEMTLAREVLDSMLGSPDPKFISEACAKDEKALKALGEDMDALLDGQYDKAFARRRKALATEDLVSRDRDSCLIVLEMVDKYEEYYNRYEQRMENALYEASKKQSKAKGTVPRGAFKGFEVVRERLVNQASQDSASKTPLSVPQ
ncbi:MAG: hypothetical protein H6867_07180 [Rhodospirillales bacterium]|nr:hypothetical protein [Rhodospirillales bacterium]MCB9995333.1 hypothetical protein [Rhodospirillales bacterium]